MACISKRVSITAGQKQISLPVKLLFCRLSAPHYAAQREKERDSCRLCRLCERRRRRDRKHSAARSRWYGLFADNSAVPLRVYLGRNLRNVLVVGSDQAAAARIRFRAVRRYGHHVLRYRQPLAVLPWTRSRVRCRAPLSPTAPCATVRVCVGVRGS